MFSAKCKEHLNNANETPLKHMAEALKIAAKLQMLVPVLLVHSVAPSIFPTTASVVMADILKSRKKK